MVVPLVAEQWNVAECGSALVELLCVHEDALHSPFPLTLCSGLRASI